MGAHLISTSQGPTVSRSKGWPHPRTTRPSRLASACVAPRPWLQLRPRAQPRPASARGAGGAQQLLPFLPQSRRIPTILSTRCADRLLNFNFYPPLPFPLVSQGCPGPSGVQAAARTPECPTDPLAGASRGPPSIHAWRLDLVPKIPSGQGAQAWLAASQLMIARECEA